MPESNIQNCLACGAPLNAPVQGGKIKCSFCGAVNVVRAHEKMVGDEIICPECGAANPKIAKHCGRCGIKLEFNCPKCGELNSYGTIYCVYCGIDIPGEVKRQQEESLRQQEESLRQQNEERRRQEELRLRLEDETKRQIHRKRISQLVIGIGILLGLLCGAGIVGTGLYQTSLSPAARATKAALAARQTATAIYRTLFHDDFSNIASGWGSFSSDNGSVGYENNGFRIHIIKTNWSMFTSLDKVFPDDIRIEVQATKIGGPDNNGIGVICRMQDKQNFYYFAISSDGYGGIAKVSQGNYDVISSDDQKWHPSTSIHQGNATNNIRADCVGNTLTLFVNGVMAASATDDSYPSGSIGLEAGTGDTGGTDILFDDINVFRP